MLSCYKSVGWLAATTFRLFRNLLELSVSSFCVGSTETFLGLPRVTREEAIAMPVMLIMIIVWRLEVVGGYLECRGERDCDLLSASSLSGTARPPCSPHTAPELSGSAGTSCVAF